MPKPLLSDIQPTKIKFQPGDRLLARVSCCLTSAQLLQLKRGIQKYAGEDVRVLVVNCLQTAIYRGQNDVFEELLAGPEHAQKQSMEVGVANLKCSVIDLGPKDQLLVIVPVLDSNLQKKAIKNWIQEWAGKDVEICVKEGKL